MDSKTINLTLPSDLLEVINKAAKASYASRSDYIRESVVMRLKSEQKLNPEPAKRQPHEDEELLRRYGMI